MRTRVRKSCQVRFLKGNYQYVIHEREQLICMRESTLMWAFNAQIKFSIFCVLSISEKGVVTAGGIFMATAKMSRHHHHHGTEAWFANHSCVLALFSAGATFSEMLSSSLLTNNSRSERFALCYVATTTLTVVLMELYTPLPPITSPCLFCLSLPDSISAARAAKKQWNGIDWYPQNALQYIIKYQ